MTDMATGSDVTKCHVTPKGFLGGVKIPVIVESGASVNVIDRYM
jgi:hypothetical protein